ncbi:hypothetical protein K505DRAFT_365669 [Melanomma pulvis-pyrius CBS 109.77]|uniref:Subtilisin-like serine protease n=1 Tax=Melanomma pulvis-pyrius CBS 109.77 TaxID=1314802 RepID=A0A6A6WZ43_9PLEO|nr:hypothetical protein K505DRAFT_365669 [Melanomma pulvis-pyrius CBS 109.77]
MHGKEYYFLGFLPAETPTSKHTPEPNAPARLPGYPNLEFADEKPLSAFLTEELECKELDEIWHHLWLMSDQSSANISPLHRQRVKFREIIPTEEPKLHLVWFYNRIHIKPLPKYLLSHAFWMCLLSPQQPLGVRHTVLLKSALGFLRSYAYLVRHESDFRIAQDRALTLVPDTVTWDDWCILRAKLLDIKDHEVSGRYRFGEIRLTRLNFYCKFLLRRAHYYRTHRQYGDYFASFYPPLLFLFGIVSVILSSMQLAATVEQIEENRSSIVLVFHAFSFIILVITCSLMVSFVLLFSVKIFNEWKHAVHSRYSSNQRKVKTDSSPS